MARPASGYAVLNVVVTAALVVAVGTGSFGYAVLNVVVALVVAVGTGCGYPVLNIVVAAAALVVSVGEAGVWVRSVERCCCSGCRCWHRAVRGFFQTDPYAVKAI